MRLTALALCCCASMNLCSFMVLALKASRNSTFLRRMKCDLEETWQKCKWNQQDHWRKQQIKWSETHRAKKSTKQNTKRRESDTRTNTQKLNSWVEAPPKSPKRSSSNVPKSDSSRVGVGHWLHGLQCGRCGSLDSSAEGMETLGRIFVPW